MVSRQEIRKAQDSWAKAIVQIGKLRKDRFVCERTADELLSDLYQFDYGALLFKPSKVSEHLFRPDKESAISYFIGGNKKFLEDTGFALEPWINIRFDNKYFLHEEWRAIVMGNYYFENLEGIETKIEYTFGYTKNGQGELKIDLHHSSFPFEPIPKKKEHTLGYS